MFPLRSWWNPRPIPRKTFDEERLEELAESIRSKGVLSPLLARRVNGHFEIVSGARRYRAAKRAGLREVPVRIAVLTDAEASKPKSSKTYLEVTCIRSRKRKGFALCSNAKGPDTPSKRYRSQDRQECCVISPNAFGSWTSSPVADAFTAGHIGIEHALLIAKLASGRAGKSAHTLL